ncbi:hypothetical protein FOA52_011496 [Chlamydomonas sp. UWO 241]|nr:hypothetical protein FOA52_011496 [Chlamydomonas sp. UWO 241]
MPLTRALSEFEGLNPSGPPMSTDTRRMPLTRALSEFEGLNPLGPPMSADTGRMPLTRVLSEIEGLNPLGPPMSADTGRMPLTSVLSEFEGLNPLGPPMSADTGRMPLTRVLSEIEGLNPLGPPMSADTGRMPLTRVLSEFEGLNPLGPPISAGALRSHGLEKKLQTRRPWGEGTRLSASEMYVRKGSPEYLGYQSDDAAHDRSRAARVASHGQLGGQPLRSSEFPFPPSDSVLAAKAHQKQQYVERPLPRQHLLAKGMNLGVQGEAVFGAALLI